MTNQHGVALVTALLVVALASMAATALMSTTSLSIHRMTALRDSEEAWWVARGVDAWVLGILRDDGSKSNYDGLDEAWAQPVDALPIDQGFLHGRLVDLQGRFNLNNLLIAPQNRQKYEEQFERLLRGLGGDLQIPPGLLGAIRDWADADQNQSFPDGAEDGVYAGLDPPYRAANRPFTVVSELLAVKGVTPDLYAALKDLVTALPLPPPGASDGTAINVNTAPEAVLLSMYVAPNAAQIHQWIESRVEKPAVKPADFDRDVSKSDMPEATSSNFFQIQGEVFVGSSRVAVYSLINRPDRTPPTVLAHSADAD